MDANPVAQTASVRFDPAVTSVEALRGGSRSAATTAPAAPPPATSATRSSTTGTTTHLARPAPPSARITPTARATAATPGMSMAAMERDMRTRFLVALACAIPIAVWSPMGKSIFGSIPPTPFGIRTDVWELVLSLPVIGYSSLIFFRGA